MGFFDWLFGHRTEADAHLNAAVERVIEGANPHLKLLPAARTRLAGPVAHALDYTQTLIASLPASLETTPASWSGSPLLRALFARPDDLAATLSLSLDLREYLASPAAVGMDWIYCIVAATRIERTILGTVLEGDELRQDVPQKTVSFTDYRLVGFSRSEEELRQRVADLALESLVLAALKTLANNKQRSEQLERYRQLLRIRLRLMDPGGAGMDAVLDSEPHRRKDIEKLRRQLADNEIEIGAAGSSGLDAVLDQLVEAMNDPQKVIQAQKVRVRLDAMNIVVPETGDGQDIDLLEFSTTDPRRPRRIAFLAHFPRSAVIPRPVDFAAALREL
jgi:hypothetical protein